MNSKLKTQHPTLPKKFDYSSTTYLRDQKNPPKKHARDAKIHANTY